MLTDARTRSNQLIVATVAVATLFGGFLFRDPVPPHGVGIGAVAPLAFLAAGMFLAVSVWRPTGKQGDDTGELQLVASPKVILGLEAHDATGARSLVATGLEDMWDANQKVIERLMGHLRRAATCLACQVASWTVLLILKQVF